MPLLTVKANKHEWEANELICPYTNISNRHPFFRVCNFRFPQCLMRLVGKEMRRMLSKQSISDVFMPVCLGNILVLLQYLKSYTTRQLFALLAYLIKSIIITVFLTLS